MRVPNQHTLVFSEHQELTDDWTFNGASTRELTHCYHDYPARMIPQVARKLLDRFGSKATLLFDPYCGTGTSLVEAMIRGIDAVGTDLNPLARLIAAAKVCTPDVNQLEKEIKRFHKYVLSSKPLRKNEFPKLEGISEPEFWFKTSVIEKLARIRRFMEEIRSESILLFFQVCFSETVREASNTRNDEFKLYRISAEKLKTFRPDVFGIITRKVHRNLKGLGEFVKVISRLDSRPRVSIYDFNTVEGVPSDILPPNSADIVITSPPYGDSHTTVAYGQYSRLSSAWLDISRPEKVDRTLMGGMIAEEIKEFPCEALNEAISEIEEKDKKRAQEVSSFYLDLFRSISNVSNVIKTNGYACYVVGNRKVKGVELPTDKAIEDFFKSFGFQHVDTFLRSIPNKRMPGRNSPSNKVGAVENTMVREHIVVMRKKVLSTRKG